MGSKQQLDPVVLEAIRVNARRSHFSEAYEGFNDCPKNYDPEGTNVCDCGKAEAEAALRLLGECPHNSFRGRTCTECSQMIDDDGAVIISAAAETMARRSLARLPLQTAVMVSGEDVEVDWDTVHFVTRHDQ